MLDDMASDKKNGGGGGGGTAVVVRAVTSPAPIANPPGADDTVVDLPVVAGEFDARVPVIAFSNATPTLARMAEAMYVAYTRNCGNLTFDGRQCPAWDGLGDGVRSHWCAAAHRALKFASSMSACDLELESR